MDDISLVAQSNSFEKLEDTLNDNLKILQNYFLNWHLTLNAKKTTAMTRVLKFSRFEILGSDKD